MSREFWRDVWAVIADPGQRKSVPDQPKDVVVYLGDDRAINVDVQYAGKSEDKRIDCWTAVVPWPRGVPLPPGKVRIAIGELPGMCQVDIQVRWM